MMATQRIGTMMDIRGAKRISTGPATGTVMRILAQDIMSVQARSIGTTTIESTLEIKHGTAADS